MVSLGSVSPSRTVGGSLILRCVIPMTSFGSFEAHLGAYSGASNRNELIGSGGRMKIFRESVSSDKIVMRARPIRMGFMILVLSLTKIAAMARRSTPFHRQENCTNGIPGMRCHKGALKNGI